MAVAVIGRMLERQRLDPLHNRFGRRLRMALVDRRQVLQPLEALRLEPPLPLVEARPVQPALPASLRDIPEFLRKLQHAQPAPRQLRIGVPRPGLRTCRSSSHGQFLLSKIRTERRLSGQLIEGTA